MEKYLENLKKYAQENHIPIIKDDGCDFLLSFLGETKPSNILEIGTAVGYSGSLMLLKLEQAKLTTVDKNIEFLNIANETFKNLNLESRVNVLAKDAFLVIQDQKKESFDFIFLDGPKGQYLKYYPYIKSLLKKGGYIFVDNIYFHNLVNGPEHVKHKLRTIVVNLRKFIDTIKNDKQVSVKFYNIGDGIAIIKKL